MLSFSPVLDGGALTVFGTAGPDNVEAYVEGEDLTVEVNDATFTFPSADVARINVFAGSGDDVITIDQSVPQPTRLFGAGGNDRIQASRQDDVILGGAGNDQIEAGNDVLTGSSGNDFLNGGVGADLVWALDGYFDVIWADDQDVVFKDRNDLQLPPGAELET